MILVTSGKIGPLFSIYNISKKKNYLIQEKSWPDIHQICQFGCFSSTVYHLTHQPSPPNKDVFRHVSLCFSDKNLELMMHSGQLLHSGIFFSNSTKVFVMTHFFTNGFETRTCTSFPNSLKCTTHIDKQYYVVVDSRQFIASRSTMLRVQRGPI